MRLIIVLLSILFSGIPGVAQHRFAVNEAVGDFPITFVLNSAQPPSTFLEVNDKLVILDFFGTWCAPCIRALPNLKTMQDKFKNEIRILLIAEENVQLLKNFIKKQQGFNLSMVADSGGVIRKLFQPPYYPYTLVIGKKGRVLALPSQGQITEEAIRKWIAEQDSVIRPAETMPVNTGTLLSTATPDTIMGKKVTDTANAAIQLSQDFLYDARVGENTSSYITKLKSLSFTELMALVKTDDEKKTFWINLYNAFTQVLLKDNPDQYKRRGKFFGSRNIAIAGHYFSLDDIEHGILRRSKIKWSLGYLNKLFPSRTEKLLRVNKLDYRLHFALNCGARSCPPIAFYRTETINQQLDVAAKAYLSGEAKYDATKDMVKLPAIMGWFRHDFGGKQKMRTLLWQYSIIPQEKSTRIRFSRYDWTLYLQNYK